MLDNDAAQAKDGKTGQPTTASVEGVLLQGSTTENDTTLHRVCLARAGEQANSGLEEGDPREEGSSSAVA